MFGLNKLADKSFVIGFVLPVLIAFLAFGLLFNDKLPSADIIAKVSSEKSFAGLTAVVLVVWTSATVLMTLNRVLYRLLEGYFGPLSCSCLKRRMERKRSETAASNRILYDAGTVREREYIKAQTEFLSQYPEAGLILPTRFGNVIRAFENYSNSVYGLDGIAGWPRLIAVIPTDFASILDGARAEVDFWVNSFFVTFAFLVATIARLGCDIGSALLVHSKLDAHDLWYVAGVVGATVSICLFYAGAVERAASWGTTVKSAYDLYLPALAKQFGYKLPSVQTDRADFWDDFNRMFLMNEPMDPERWKQFSLTDQKEEKAAEREKDKQEDDFEVAGDEDPGKDSTDTET